MATDQELEEIRRRSDVVDLISHYVTLKKAGANYKALCPFHEERTGSFMVSPEKQIYKCFGCNEGGDIFGFIMKMEGLTFPEAVQFLADRTGVKLEKTKFEPTQEKKDDKNRLLAVNDLSAKYFQMILIQHTVGAKAKEYLHKRGINDDTIKDFRLGYAPSQRGLADFLIKKGYSTSEIAAAGKPDRFYNRIMFPICDPMGNVIAFTGREFPDGQGPKYLNTAETVLFHKSRAVYGLDHAKMAIRQKQSIIFVEGQMDVISSHQLGIQNTVASSGTALTLDHLKVLYRYAQHFILAFDNDEAGQKATEKVIEMMLAQNFTCDVIVFPDEFKDAGEIIEKDPPLWPELVKTAIPAVQWHFDRAFSPFQESNLDGTNKKQITTKLLPILGQIIDPVEKSHYLQKLSKRLDISEAVLNQKIGITKNDSSYQTNQSPSPTNIKPNDKIPDSTALESEIILYFLYHIKLANEFISKLNEDYFPLEYQTIVKEVKIWYNQSDTDKVDKSELIVFLHSRLEESDRLFLDIIINSSLNPSKEIENESSQTDPDSVREEITQSLEHLHSLHHENEKLKFANAIAVAEESGDRTKVKVLLKELQTFLGGAKNGQKNN